MRVATGVIFSATPKLNRQTPGMISIGEDEGWARAQLTAIQQQARKSTTLPNRAGKFGRDLGEPGRRMIRPGTHRSADAFVRVFRADEECAVEDVHARAHANKGCSNPSCLVSSVAHILREMMRTRPGKDNQIRCTPD